MIPSSEFEPVTQRELIVRIDALRDLIIEKFEHTDTKIQSITDAAEISYPNRGEYTKLDAKVAALETLWAKLEGKASQSSANAAMLLALIATVVSIGGLLWDVVRKMP